MADSEEQLITTLLFPNECVRHLNQMSGLTTCNIVYLKRKFLSKSGYELVTYPLTECDRITYYDERPLLSLILGALPVLTVGVVGYGVFKYWDELSPATRIPVGVLFLVSLYGFRAIFLARRYRVVFSLRDGSKLLWKTRAGDYKYKEANVSKVVELAKSRGILAEAR
jgi:hypothetical protein